ncbi:T-cell receptor gamma alternate reading frame protein isoform X2 [Pithys albifrons albifrons]|uniref:T-cell receptor gamma alternate reading frame protein isoform X2 n=1 Tax=Pithys albifrons albifrons TaxID=3385563 RepID=UPI003A5D01AE
MLLLAVLVATATWSYGFTQEIPMQSPISITMFQNRAQMICDIKILGESFDVTFIHWYQQKEGEAPKRLLFSFEGETVVESNFDPRRYTVETYSNLRQCSLKIKDVNPNDAATYYCAYWDHYNKVFGSGTKLIVSGKSSSAPANSEILQKQHDNQMIYVCLIEKFYPGVIRVTWTDEEKKEVTDNVVRGDTWKPTEEGDYSIASWLTVPAENKDKNYYCKYEHESQQRSLPTHESSMKNEPQEANCSTVFNGDVTLPDVLLPDHLMHRAAYLVYIILLLKSSMYYFVILFFIYRMWASNKHQGKKV